MPEIDVSSDITGHYKVIRVYDGDTLTIQTPKGTTPSLRLVGVDTPEINASLPAEKARAVAAREYLRRLVLNKFVFITFEKSDTTLDGVARGPYCRPLAYVFIKDAAGDPVFVNLEIVWQGHGVKYFKYDFAYQDFFKLDEATARSRIASILLETPQLEAPSVYSQRILASTWARLKSF